jgi:enoyl-CoA hydratase/carnithine racemase
VADLEYTVKDGIGMILLNRPEKKNAFTYAMIDEWAQALRSARTDPDVRVVVVTGAGNAFCSGVDWASSPATPPTPSPSSRCCTTASTGSRTRSRTWTSR